MNLNEEKLYVGRDYRKGARRIASERRDKIRYELKRPLRRRGTERRIEALSSPPKISPKATERSTIDDSVFASLSRMIKSFLGY